MSWSDPTSPPEEMGSAQPETDAPAPETVAAPPESSALQPEPAASEADPATDTPRPKRPARKKREPVTTLQGFFARRTAKAPSFLKDLAEAGIWQFADDDAQAALESHAEKDRDFARTTQLMAAALKDKEGRFVRPVIGFGEWAIRDRLRANSYFIGVNLESMSAPEEKLAVIARALGARLREAGRRAESANLLLATILWLNHAQGLDPTTAIDTMTTTLGASQPATRDRDRAKLIWLGEHPKDVRPVADLLAPSVEAASRAASEIEAAAHRAEDERSRKESAEAEVVRLEREIADLREMVTKLNADVARFDETATAARVHATHDLAQLKARIAGVLDSQLSSLATTANDALASEPPRLEIARQRVDAIVRELERQVAWLRS